MNIISKLLDLFFQVSYWKEYRKFKKIKTILSEFFNGEDNELQNSFIKNFDYPTTMVNSPVRYEKNSGDIYWTLNFKSKEHFTDTNTKENAYANSLALLDKLLPFDVINELEPLKPIHIPDTFTLLCSLKVVSGISFKKTVYSVIQVLVLNSILITILLIILKYFVK